MSFILDALKKSEAERQRQSGPTLLELRITQPPRRYPAWAVWVGALLALNFAVLIYALLLRRPAPPEPAIAAAAPAGTAAAAPPLTMARASAPAVSPSAPGVAAAPATAATAAAGPAATPAGVTAVAPLAPAPAPAAGTAAAGTAAASTAAPASANPADDEPAVPAGAAPSRPVDYSALPSLASLGGDLPALQLNMLVYSTLADERYALINMHRVRDGDVLPEGPRVLSIMRDGVALDYHGQDFMLRSSGSPP